MKPNFGAHAVRRLLGQRDAGVRPEDRLQEVLQVAQAGAGARACIPTPVSATTGGTLPPASRCAPTSMRPPLATRVDAVADRVLDQRQQAHLRNGSARSDGSMSTVNASRSGMRISISSR